MLTVLLTRTVKSNIADCLRIAAFSLPIELVDLDQRTYIYSKTLAIFDFEKILLSPA
jgi:hypothetical protein